MKSGHTFSSLLGNSGARGVTLIELMIGLVIGLLITLMVSLIYSNAFQMFRTQSGVAKMEESGRSVVSVMSREIQHAGFLACGGVYGAANYSLTSQNNYPPIMGYSSATAAGDAKVLDKSLPDGLSFAQDMDKKDAPVLVVSHGSEETAGLGRPIVGNAITLASNAPFRWSNLPAANGSNPGRQFIVADCSQSELFSAGSVSDFVITAPTLVRNYDATARIMLAERSVFFLAKPDSSALYPSLYQASTVAGNTTYLRIADNVAKVAYSYGIGSRDGSFKVIEYSAAPQDWSLVKSVRVSILSAASQRSATNQKGDDNKYIFNGAQYSAPSDRTDIFREIEFTVALRNKLAQLVSN